MLEEEDDEGYDFDDDWLVDDDDEKADGGTEGKVYFCTRRVFMDASSLRLNLKRLFYLVNGKMQAHQTFYRV